MGRRLLWQIYAPFVLVVLVSVLAVTTVATRSLRQFYIEQTRDGLTAKAYLLENLLGPRLGGDAAPAHTALDRDVKRLGRDTALRITVILPGGTVIADSDEDPAVMGDHSARPEIADALAGRIGASQRFSETIGRDLLYVALATPRSGTARAVLRTSVALTSIDAALARVYRSIALAALAVAAMAALFALLVSRRISRPLEQLGTGAARFAQGELSHRLPVSGSHEIAKLAQALNEMAVELDQRIRTVVEQRNEQDAVLASMVEGVIAVDEDENIITFNDAAARLLGVARANAVGRAIQEAVRNPELQRFVKKTLATTEPVAEELTFHTDSARVWQAQGARLHEADKHSAGAVVVLNDITEVRRLETIRSDFVANVSHELKTPITAVKGFLETLRDGALDDRENARRFVDIAARQADRLDAIINDLLALSRLEQSGADAAIETGPVPLRGVLECAVQACSERMGDSRVKLELECDPDIQVPANAPLLEQAVSNLIDNAVKYSPQGTRVLISAAQDGETVSIRVRDDGPGIERKHHARLFERFYRIDKARSRDLGGTGLGLAIVKHIAQAHRGSVAVQSEPGRGSTFRIDIPVS